MARARGWAPALVMAAVAFLLSHWIDSRWAQHDDVYITYQYARRLASGAGFTFSPGAPPTYGSTTPLWTLILALFSRFGLAPHVGALWLGSLLHAVIAVVLFAIARRLAGKLAGAFAGLAWACGLAVFFRLDGMETPLLLALMLLTCLGLLEGWRPCAIGVLGGLLLLTRPDAVLFFAAALLALRLRRAAWWPAAVLSLAVYLPWALYAWCTFGDIVPLSVRAKAAASTVSVSKAGLDEALATFFPLSSQAALFGACALLAALGAVRVWGRQPALRPLLAWLPAYALAMWALRYPNFAWYYAPLFPLGLALLAVGAAEVAARRASRAALCTALLAGLFWCGWTATRSIRNPAPWVDAHKRLALLVRQRARPGDVAACQEVGHLAYWSGIRVLDLCGLNSPEAIPYARLGRVDGAIRRARPRFVLGVSIPGRWVAEYRKVASTPYWGAPGTKYCIWERER